MCRVQLLYRLNYYTLEINCGNKMYSQRTSYFYPLLEKQFKIFCGTLIVFIIQLIDAKFKSLRKLWLRGCTEYSFCIDETIML